MPHVNEFHPARRTAAGLALVVLLLAGCSETQRKAPLMADPAAQNLARRSAPATREAFEAAVRSDALPPASTGVSIGASRRA